MPQKRLILVTVLPHPAVMIQLTKISGGRCRIQPNEELMPVDKEQTSLTSVHSGNKYGKSRNGGLS
jgi:hypothetical protein